MGFWDTAGKIASGAAKAVKETNDEAKEYRSEYEGQSDEFLKRKVQSGTMAQKMAAAHVLGQRRG
jgi:hypothetical protein